ncbi:Exodeoxyribonuclease 7 large subunit [Geodia barretti]|uniref:Exodeoxyribonuclease 7 large subunit n=1 Tax=Geodia barretti TaxID=519541 RepID=A0AA35TXQ0_GEOBA|nr:Exodeoxyribonuclease 7 large subunit [Geodia barretti]
MRTRCWTRSAGAAPPGGSGSRPKTGSRSSPPARSARIRGRSRYQIVVERLELSGAGALLALLEARKKALAAEGLFDEARKRELPYLPETIGVVTSPTGAVIRDILHRIEDRFPRRVLVWPVTVQGAGAAEEIAAAIAGFNRLDAATPIVARGGGSLEDLWAFNEEVVVRAAAASDIPLIAAVGHETDVTLIDLAADLRAPTPTAAAEIAVPVRADLLERTHTLEHRLGASFRRLIAERRARLAHATGHLSADRLAQRLGQARQASDLLAVRLGRAGRAALSERAARIGTAARLLESYSYRGVLARGFAVVRDQRERPVTSAAAVKPGAGLSLEFHDGRAAARATGRPKRRKAGRDEDDGGQAPLL